MPLFFHWRFRLFNEYQMSSSLRISIHIISDNLYIMANNLSANYRILLMDRHRVTWGQWHYAVAFLEKKNWKNGKKSYKFLWKQKKIQRILRGFVVGALMKMLSFCHVLFIRTVVYNLHLNALFLRNLLAELLA